MWEASFLLFLSNFASHFIIQKKPHQNLTPNFPNEKINRSKLKVNVWIKILNEILMVWYGVLFPYSVCLHLQNISILLISYFLCCVKLSPVWSDEIFFFFSILIITDVSKLDTGLYTMDGKKSFYNFQFWKKMWTVT